MAIRTLKFDPQLMASTTVDGGAAAVSVSALTNEFWEKTTDTTVGDPFFSRDSDSGCVVFEDGDAAD